jgi:hypothetical protein
MTFKPAIWYPISAILTLGNLAGVAFAAGAAEPLHATVHAGLAVAFAVWAQRLRGQGAPDRSELQAPVEALEFEVSKLREELNEAQERLDFTERMLAQGQETRREDPPR